MVYKERRCEASKKPADMQDVAQCSSRPAAQDARKLQESGFDKCFQNNYLCDADHSHCKAQIEKWAEWITTEIFHPLFQGDKIRQQNGDKNFDLHNVRSMEKYFDRNTFCSELKQFIMVKT